MSQNDGEPAWQGKTYNASKDKKHLTGINKEGRIEKESCLEHSFYSYRRASIGLSNEAFLAG